MSQYPQGPVSAPPVPAAGGVAPPVPADGLAIASMICGIIGLAGTCFYGFGVLPAIAGLICGMMSKSKGGIRTAGIVCSSIAIGLCVLAIVLLILGFGLMAVGAASGGGTSP